MSLFYLQDSRSHVGGGLTFWAKDGKGYVTDLDKAELYNAEQATSHRDTDIPWPKDYIDARAHYGVDWQLMDEVALEQTRIEFASEIAAGIRKIWSADYIDTIRRRLVWRQDVDLKQALRGAGIKLPKPKRVREMVFNCGGCGRFISDRQRFQSDCRNCGADNLP